MSNVFEPAPTGRAKCRGCGQAISRGEIRFGERLPNPFADGEMTVWFHPLCAAYKRPEPFLLELAETTVEVPERDALERAARASASQRRIPRIDGVEKARRGQARCRSCKELIARESWRIRIVFYEDGRFMPGGFIHVSCRHAYFETGDVLKQVLYFSPALSDDERTELTQAWETGSAQ